MDSYKSAGVDIDAGNKAVSLIKKEIEKTRNDCVINGIGAFGGAYSLKKIMGMKDPVLVSTIDGVGTKLKVASEMNKWDSVGEDIVNHCADDILAMGAKPLFFLDYVASDSISPEKIASVVSGMAKACVENDCALIGGETAEMPGVYGKGEHDIAGCMVGVVEKGKIIDGSKIKEGDVLVGLASNGLHTNGYSLARKVINDAGLSLDGKVNGLENSLGEELLRVHKSYSKSVLSLAEKFRVVGIAHITGGGLEENVGRIIPQGLKAEFNFSSIDVPVIFRIIMDKGNIEEKEMFRVFNMGVGLVIVVEKNDVNGVVGFLNSKGENSFVVGSVNEK